MCYRQNHGRCVAACRYRAAHARPASRLLAGGAIRTICRQGPLLAAACSLFPDSRPWCCRDQLASLNSPSHFWLDGYKLTITLRDHSSHELSVSTGSFCATVNLNFGRCRSTSGRDEPKGPTILPSCRVPWLLARRIGRACGHLIDQSCTRLPPQG
jgi:hypothetical protein